MSGVKTKQQVPAGYKQTEVGVIPVDWGCVNLGNLGDIVRGGSPRPAGDPKYFNGKYISWLTVASLTNINSSQIIVNSTLSMLTELGSKQSRRLKKNTLIISNSGATLGVAKILGIECCANDGVAALINKKDGYTPFLVHYLNTQTKRLHDDIATGNGQPNLNKALISAIPLPFPKYNEQTAIANTLTDVDNLLTALQKLIDKKQAIKTATMQQLLTGKTRLPQFAYHLSGKKQGQAKGTKMTELGEIPEDWEVTNLSIHASLVSSGTTGTNQQGSYPLYGSTGIIGTTPYADYHGRSILIARVGANAGTLYDVDGQYGVSDNTIIVKFKNTINSIFCKLILIHQNLNSLVFGSGQPLITGSQLKNLKLPSPPLPEQTAIADILTDMDQEIQALEARLAKTRQIKQAMMQELLTGRIRLPFDNE